MKEKESKGVCLACTTCIYIYRKKFFQDFFEYIFYTRRTTRDLIVKAGCNVNARFVIP